MCIIINKKSVSESKIIQGYENKENKYVITGIDSAKYVKYYYSLVKGNEYKNNAYYKKVQDTDVKNILGYFENFEKIFSNEEEKENKYDFDKNIIQEGDYYRIETKEGQDIGESKYEKYDDYTVYYYDVDSQILYFLHLNI